MGIRGVRVYSWSPFETKAFGSLFYEVKKKVVHWTTIVGSTWSSMIPTMIATCASPRPLARPPRACSPGSSPPPLSLHVAHPLARLGRRAHQVGGERVPP